MKEKIEINKRVGATIAKYRKVSDLIADSQLQPTEQVYQLDRLFNQLNGVERDKLISLIEQIIEWKNSGKNYRTFSG